jgi:hypothetical protein
LKIIFLFNKHFIQTMFFIGKSSLFVVVVKLLQRLLVPEEFLKLFRVQSLTINHAGGCHSYGSS